mmetsp:Transcript_13523/g.47029  ORF Transcript_13523/g.47029 Transcript_13523/m.47029 type:complete len:384 (-) Transcript_13523:1317-2468(-)
MGSGGIDLSRNATNGVLFVGFNQDQSCFAVGFSDGFKIFNCNPFKETISRKLDCGIRYIEMLFRCNILALVGTQEDGKFPPNKVIIWDDQRRKDIGELSFRHEVKAVRLRRDKVVVILEFKVLVYKFSDLSPILEVDTVSNPKGICALCPSPNNTVLACPGSHRGHVRLELMEMHKTFNVQAHNSPLGCMALTLDGSRLATASERGTIIRVFDTLSGKQLQEVRRGASAAEISSLAFDHKCSLLSCSSVRGTVHVFTLVDAPSAPTSSENSSEERAGAAHQTNNCRSSLSFMGSMVTYFNSEWSFAKFRLPIGDGHTICSFASEKNSILVVTATGHLYMCEFKPEGPPGQECEATWSRSFLPEEVQSQSELELQEGDMLPLDT